MLISVDVMVVDCILMGVRVLLSMETWLPKVNHNQQAGPFE